MTKRISLLLICTAFTVSLASCGSSNTGNSTVLGEWSADVDLQNAYNRLLSEADVDGFMLSEYVTIREFPITLQAVFLEDGTYRINIEQNSLNRSLDKLRDDLKRGLEKAVKSEFDPYTAIMGMSMEDYMSSMGLSMDILLDGMIEQTISSGELTEGLEREGLYYVTEDRLYISDSMSNSPDSNIWLSYAVKGRKQLIVESGSGGPGTYALNYRIFPLEFKRTKDAPPGAEAPTEVLKPAPSYQRKNESNVLDQESVLDVSNEGGNSTTTQANQIISDACIGEIDAFYIGTWKCYKWEDGNESGTMDLSIVLNEDGTGYLDDPSMSFVWRANDNIVYAYWIKRVFDDLPSMFTMWMVNSDIATDMGDPNGSWVGYFKHT